MTISTQSREALNALSRINNRLDPLLDKLTPEESRELTEIIALDTWSQLSKTEIQQHVDAATEFIDKLSSDRLPSQWEKRFDRFLDLSDEYIQRHAPEASSQKKQTPDKPNPTDSIPIRPHPEERPPYNERMQAHIDALNISPMLSQNLQEIHRYSVMTARLMNISDKDLEAKLELSFWPTFSEQQIQTKQKDFIDFLKSRLTKKPSAELRQIVSQLRTAMTSFKELVKSERIRTEREIQTQREIAAETNSLPQGLKIRRTEKEFSAKDLSFDQKSTLIANWLRQPNFVFQGQTQSNIEKIINSITDSQELDALILVLYTEYHDKTLIDSTDKKETAYIHNLTSFFKYLHGRTKNQEVIQAERAMQLFPSWAYLDKIWYEANYTTDEDSSTSAPTPLLVLDSPSLVSPSLLAFFEQGHILPRIHYAEIAEYEFEGRTITRKGHQLKDAAERILRQVTEQMRMILDWEYARHIKLIINGKEIMLGTIYQSLNFTQAESLVREITLGHKEKALEQDDPDYIQATSDYLLRFEPKNTIQTVNDCEEALRRINPTTTFFAPSLQKFVRLAPYTPNSFSMKEKYNIMRILEPRKTIKTQKKGFEKHILRFYDNNGLINWIKLRALGEKGLTRFALNIFEQQKIAPYPLDSQVLEIFDATLSLIAFTPYGDDLLSRIFASEEYQGSRDVKFISLFKLLHNKTNSNEIKAEEAASPLYGYWSLRAIETQTKDEEEIQHSPQAYARVVLDLSTITSIPDNMATLIISGRYETLSDAKKESLKNKARQLIEAANNFYGGKIRLNEDITDVNIKSVCHQTGRAIEIRLTDLYKLVPPSDTGPTPITRKSQLPKAIKDEEKKELTYKIIADFLTFKYGPFYSLSLEAMDYYIRDSEDDIFTFKHGNDTYTIEASHFLLPGSNLLSHNLSNDLFEFMLVQAKEREAAYSKILSAKDIDDPKEVDTALIKLFETLDIVDNPTMFAPLMLGESSQIYHRIEMPGGKILHASYKELMTLVTSHQHPRIYNTTLPDAERHLVKYQAAHIPLAFRTSKKKIREARIELLRQWVEDNNITQSKLMDLIDRNRNENREFILVDILKKEFPHFSLGILEHNDVLHPCFFRPSDLIAHLGIPEKRTNFIKADFELFRQVGILKEDDAEGGFFRYINEFPVDELNTDEFSELIANVLYRELGDKNATNSTLHALLTRPTLAIVTTQEYPVVATYHNELLTNPKYEERRKNFHEWEEKLIAKGEYHLRSFDVKQYFKRIYLNHHFGITPENTETEEFKRRMGVISINEIKNFILSTVFKGQGYNLNRISDVTRMVEDHDLFELIKYTDNSALNLRDAMTVFRPELANRYGILTLVRVLEEYAEDNGLRNEDTITTIGEKANRLTNWFSKNLNKLDEIDDASLQRIEFIYRRSFAQWIETDKDAVLSWLKSQQSANIHDMLKSVLASLYEHILSYTEGLQLPKVMKTQTKDSPYFNPDGLELKPYQAEAILEISQPENKRMMLADEPGMGKSVQAIGVAELVGANKTIWVTTNSNKQTVQEEILKHSNNDPSSILILSGKGSIRHEQLRNLDDIKYIIVNYEALRKLEERDPEGYALLTDKLNMLIVDETQRADNEYSQQGDAIQKLQAETERLLLLTATPYKHSIIKIFTILKLLDPETYNNRTRDDFIKNYANRGDEGLAALHDLLSQYMIRRKKSEVYKTADPNLPLEEQKGILPKQTDVPFQREGGFFMTEEQSRATVRLLFDSTRGPLTFSKIRDLLSLLRNPKAHGIEGANPRLDETRRIVKKHLLEGKKIILWAHHREAISQLNKMLKELKTELAQEYPDQFGNGFDWARFDGSPSACKEIKQEGETIMQRDLDRMAFQNEDEPRIMINGLQAGAEGLTFSAGEVSIFYELPMQFIRHPQAYDRNHRVDGEFPRYEQPYYTLIGQISPAFIETIKDPGLRALLRTGSVDEILFHRLKEMKLYFDMVMDGLISENEFNKRIRRSLRSDVSTRFGVKASRQTGYIYTENKKPSRALTAQKTIHDYYNISNTENKRRLNFFTSDDLRTDDLYRFIGNSSEDKDSLSLVQTSIVAQDKSLLNPAYNHFIKHMQVLHAKGNKISDIIKQHKLDTILNNPVTSPEIKALALPLANLEIHTGQLSFTRAFINNLINQPSDKIDAAYTKRIYRAAVEMKEAASTQLLNTILNKLLLFHWSDHDLFTKTFVQLAHLLPFITEQQAIDLIESEQNPQTLFQKINAMGWQKVQFLTGHTVSSHLKKRFHKDPSTILNMFSASRRRRNSAAEKRQFTTLITQLNKTHPESDIKEDLEHTSVYRGARNNLITAEGNNPILKDFTDDFESFHQLKPEDKKQRQRISFGLRKRFEPWIAHTVQRTSKYYGEHESFLIKQFSLIDDIKEKRKYLEDILACNEALASDSSFDPYMIYRLTKIGIEDPTHLDSKSRDYYRQIINNSLLYINATLLIADNDWTNPHLLELIKQIHAELHTNQFSSATYINKTERLLKDLSNLQRPRRSQEMKVSITEAETGSIWATLEDFMTRDLDTLSTMAHALGSRSHKVLVAKDDDNKTLGLAVVKLRYNEIGRPSWFVEKIISKENADINDLFYQHLLLKSKTSKGRPAEVTRASTLPKSGENLERTHRSIGGFGEKEYDFQTRTVNPTPTPEHQAWLVHNPTAYTTPLQSELHANQKTQSTIKRSSGTIQNPRRIPTTSDPFKARHHDATPPGFDAISAPMPFFGSITARPGFIK